MDTQTFIFYLLGFLIIFFGILTVTTKRIFRAAIFLLFTLVTVAGFYFLINFEFLAVVQIVIYVGGIVVLIIFSVLLTQQIAMEIERPKIVRVISISLASLAGFVLCFNLIAQNTFQPNNEPAVKPTMQAIGTQLLNLHNFGYILPFEVVSILLLAAMIGCIIIAVKIK